MARSYETVRVLPFENDCENAELCVAHEMLSGVERYRITDENDQWWMATDDRSVEIPLSVVREYAAAMEGASLAGLHLMEAWESARVVVP